MNTKQKQAFVDQYRRVHPELEKYCKALIYNTEEVQDLMSEAVAIAYEKYHTLRDINKFKFFLFGICSRLFKKKISRKRVFVDFDHPLVKNTGSNDDPSMGAEIKLLYKAIEKLNPNEKEVIALFELTGFSLNEIAELKQMNLSTVKTHLSRARKNLSELLNPQTKLIKEKS